MSNHRQRERGAALVYALVFAAIVTLTGAAIYATRARSTQDTRTVTQRAQERATSDAAVEHGKAIVQQAIGAQLPLEQLAELDVTNAALNDLAYELDLSLAAYGDVRANLTGGEWAAARMDPLTGQPLRHLTSNVNIEALTLHGEWRDATVHHPPSTSPITLGIHQEDVYARDIDAPIPILIPFPSRNAPPAQVHARGSTNIDRHEIGVLLDTNGNVWEWPLDNRHPPERLPQLTRITSITTGDRFAIAVTDSGELHAWGLNPNGPLRPNHAGIGEALDAPTLITPQPQDPAPILAVAAGDHHVIALDARGRVITWGANDQAQLGRQCGGTCAAGEIEFDEDVRIVSVSAGGNRSAALDHTGRLIVWGANQPPTPLTDANGAPLHITHYSLATSEGLAVTTDGQLVTYNSPTATPLSLRVQTPSGRTTSVHRADLLRAGRTHHAAIIGTTLITWPAGTTNHTSATRQGAPHEPPTLEHEPLTNVTVTPGDRSLTLEWSPPHAHALTYQIQQSHNARDWEPAASTTAARYHLTNLSNGRPYYLLITAHDEYGDATHEHLTGPHIPAGPPDTPTNGRVTPENETLALAWDEPSNNGSPITHYLIEQSTNGVLWRPLAHQPTGPSVRVTSLENDREYLHRVTAVNSAGRSQPLTLPPGTPQGPPHAPTIERADGHMHDTRPAITITWRPAKSATSYRAHYSSDGADWRTITAPADATSLTIPNLEQETPYSVYLTATNQHGESRPSARVNVTTRNAPSAPSDLTATLQGTSSAAITWAAPQGASGITAYRLERRDPRTGTWSVIATPTNPAHADTGLQAGWTYGYRVAATGPGGTGAYSGTTELTTGIGAPGAPTHLRLHDRTQTSITLAWDAPQHTGGAPDNAITYQIQRRAHSTETWSTLSTQGDANLFTDRSFVPGFLYTYRVIARNGTHASAPSDTLTVTTPVAVATPAEPRVTGREHLSITLEWDALDNPHVTGYEIERAEHRAPYEPLATVRAATGETLTFTDTRVTAGVTYTYRVRARTSHGVTPPSPASPETAALARSNAPRDLSATVDATTGATHLTWSAPTHTGASTITGYTIQRATNHQEWETIAPAHLHTTYTDDTAAVGKEHSYRVAAINELGPDHPSPYTAPTPPVTLIRAPDQPQAPSVTPSATDATTPLITWVPPFNGGTPITHYILERHSSNGWHQIATPQPHEMQTLDHTAEAGVLHQYRITAVNAAGQSEPSPPSDAH